MKCKLLFPLLLSLLIVSECGGEPIKRWQGVYLAGLLGYGWKEDHAQFTNPNYFNTLGPQVLGNSFTISSKSGFVGGGALGFNGQLNRWIIGAEGGALSIGLKKTIASPYFPALDTFRAKLSYLVFAKLRTGVAIDSFFPFISGGWAGSSVTMQFNDFVNQVKADSGSKWANGWTLGGGCSYKLFKHFALGLVYDYYTFYLTKKQVNCPSCGVGEGFNSPDIKDRITAQTVAVRFDILI